MHNEEVIHRFYSAFQKLDYRTMQDCYRIDVLFSDPVFGLLQNGEPQAMWEMLCTRATDFSLRYGNIKQIDDEYVSCDWVAHYHFSASKRKIVNRITAHFRIVDGKITEHTDQFSLYKWSKQAFGLSGFLFGWSSWMQNRIRHNARASLKNFIKKGGSIFS